LTETSSTILGERETHAAVEGGVADIAVEFQDTVIALRRVARRAARRNLPELPSSESELLSLVDDLKGIGVNEAARLMQVSPNTVSTLIRSLTRRGLLERLSDPSDRRAALLHVTGAGAARIRRIRRQRAEAITNAMLALEEPDRRALAEAVPAMRQLLSELERRDSARNDSARSAKGKNKKNSGGERLGHQEAGE
jgi:DNA-binding MarR family transcriptional regulator